MEGIEIIIHRLISRSKRGRIVSLLLTGLMLAGCARYHPMPLTPEVAARALKVPDIQELKIQVSKIRHPLLRPVPFDLSNGLSPDEAALLAIIINPRLKAARDEKAIASAQLLKAGILPNPQISGEIDVPTGGYTAGTFLGYTLGLNWDWTSLIGRGLRIKGARAHRDSVELGIAWQEWQVAESARLHWLRLYWLNKKVLLLSRAAEGYKKNLKVVKKAVDMGDKTAVDLAAARASYQRSLISLEEARERQGQERLALNQALGLPASRDIPLEKIVIPDSWYRIDPSSLLADIRDRRLDLAALRLGYESQEQAVRAAVLSQFPKINIGLVEARDTGNVITTGPALTIDIPFFDRGQGRIALERATRKRLFDDYVARLFDARSKITSLADQIHSMLSRIQEIHSAIDAERDLVNVYQRAMRHGNADILTLYQARMDLIGLETELLDLRQTLTDLRIALETASGTYAPLTHTVPDILEGKRP